MIVEHVKNRKYRQWLCGSCGKLLGLIYANGTLAIKYKELFLWVEGSVKTICRNCQTENNYKYKTDIEELGKL